MNRGTSWNKKGVMGMSMGLLIGGIIAMFILVAVFWGPIRIYASESLGLAWLIPSFDDTKPPLEGVQYIRYDITGSKIQYHDGLKWVGFEGKVLETNDMKIDGRKVDGDFRLYFSNPAIDSLLIDIPIIVNHARNFLEEKHADTEPDKIEFGRFSAGQISMFSERSLLELVKQEYPWPLRVTAWWREWKNSRFTTKAGDYYFYFYLEVPKEALLGVFIVNPIENKIYFIETKENSNDLQDKNRGSAEKTGNDADVIKKYFTDSYITKREKVVFAKPILLKIEGDGTMEFCVDYSEKEARLTVDLFDPYETGEDCSTYKI